MIVHRRRTTLVNMGVNVFTVVLAVTSGIVLVPLYLRHVPADLYGAWLASGNVVAWMAMLDPGISTVLQQRVAAAYGGQDAESVSGWIASGLWMTAGISIAILVAGFVCSFFLSAWLKLPRELDGAELVGAFRWSVIGSALMIFYFSVTAANLGLQSVLGIGILFTVMGILRIVLVVTMLKAGYGLLALAVPTVIVAVLLAGSNLFFLHARLRQVGILFSWAPTRLRAMAGLLSFTAFSRCADVLANNMDLFLVARFLGPESVNILKFTRCAPDMSRMMVERPATAMHASLSHLLGEGGVDRARAIMLRLHHLIIWLLALLAGGIAVFNHDFVRLWVGDRFYGGDSVNLLIVAGMIVTASVSVLSVLCFAAGNIRGNSLAGISQALVYLPLLWVGGNWLGIKGVVGASLLSMLLTQGWYFPRAFRRMYRVAAEDRDRLLRAAVIAGLAAGVPAMVFFHVHPANWFMFSAWVGAFVASYSVLLLLLSGEARTEVRNAQKWIERCFSWAFNDTKK